VRLFLRGLGIDPGPFIEACLEGFGLLEATGGINFRVTGALLHTILDFGPGTAVVTVVVPVPEVIAIVTFMGWSVNDDLGFCVGLIFKVETKSKPVPREERDTGLVLATGLSPKTVGLAKLSLLQESDPEELELELKESLEIGAMPRP